MEPDSKGLLQTRALEVLALAMAGDGLLALLQPRRHMGLWRIGPRPLRELSDFFYDRPRFTRLVGAFSVAAGLWLPHRQKPR